MCLTLLTRTIPAALLSVVTATSAVAECTRDAMIVFDGSGSMSEMGFNQLDLPRIVEARDAMHRAIPAIAQIRRLGLIIYGPGQNDACSNIDLRFAPQANAAGQILGDVDALAPAGATPLTAAIAQAAEVLDFRKRPGVIVLVTDGKETCGGTPCLLAADLAADAQDLTVHVIGFKVRGDHFDWDAGLEIGADTIASCMAERTGGEFISAETIDDLVAALNVTLGCPVYGMLGRPPGAVIR